MRVSTDFDKYLRQMRLVGEMAGCLGLVVIVASDKSVNKDGIRDLLKRYEAEFDAPPDTIEKDK